MKTAFPPIVNEHSKILILGTMPGEKSIALQEYYAHAGNQFWKIIFAIYNQPFTKDYIKKKQILLDNQIALWDVIQYCEREGSADSNIIEEKPNDFAGFFLNYPNIKTIYFASKAAKTYYLKHVRREFDLMIYGVLPSPSSANTWKTFHEKVKEWKIIRTD
ncbi:DNA-deoxyinosine glycosylase [Pedobacter sp. MR2016-19]|uniref:DNA-deoxyinosine glycosylase n=1 Tax=Pedobacter sp. MR2016-19 TaxID=2780089 RepID=UPI001874B461|nr:DNA-deoxyinosine glycosylase [Pedobacter sp. MR2016-19]MBE5320942.1 DNA-deoxyinosine glycosylase [Pedobacter sp. MR2016-19]